MPEVFRVFSDASGGNRGHCSYAGVIIYKWRIWAKYRGFDRVGDSNMAEFFGVLAGLLMTPKGAKVSLYSDCDFVGHTLAKICRQIPPNFMRSFPSQASEQLSKMAYQAIEDRNVEINWHPRNSLPYLHWAHLVAGCSEDWDSRNSVWTQLNEGDRCYDNFLSKGGWNQSMINSDLQTTAKSIMTFHKMNSDNWLRDLGKGFGCFEKILDFGERSIDVQLEGVKRRLLADIYGEGGVTCWRGRWWCV